LLLAAPVLLADVTAEAPVHVDGASVAAAVVIAHEHDLRTTELVADVDEVLTGEAVLRPGIGPLTAGAGEEGLLSVADMVASVLGGVGAVGEREIVVILALVVIGYLLMPSHRPWIYRVLTVEVCAAMLISMPQQTRVVVV
jgi:hypothetical protein